MKKVLLILGFVLINSMQLFSQDLCDGITCPDGWYLNSTGWVNLKVSDDPETYCNVLICYCANWEESEGPNFAIKRIVWDDPDLECIGSVEWPVFKRSMVAAIIQQHISVMPPTICPELSGSYSVELYMSECYAIYSHNAMGFYIPCNGDGYCAQMYLWCWDITANPPIIVAEEFGEPQQWPNYCEEPDLDPTWELVQGCRTVCQ